MEIKFKDSKDVYYRICDVCEKEDGRPLLYWKNPEFAICLECIKNLFLKYCAKDMKIINGEKVFVKRNGVSERIRNKVLKRDGRKCQICGSKENLVLDHIIPFVYGGNTELNNLRTLCKSCNSKKGSKYEHTKAI